MDKKEMNLCDCLYDTIICENDRCMWEDGVYYGTDSIQYVEELLYDVAIGGEDYDEYDDSLRVNDVYERLCILNNESMTMNDVIYTKVIKIITGSGKEGYHFNLAKIEKTLDISVWSNGSLSPDDQRYLIYWKGYRIDSTICPPMRADLIRAIESGAKTHKELAEIQNKIYILSKINLYLKNLWFFARRMYYNEVEKFEV